MDALITKELALKAILHGACELPKIGAKISSLSTSTLIWAQEHSLVTREEVREAIGKDTPVWLLSGDGDVQEFLDKNGDG